MTVAGHRQGWLRILALAVVALAVVAVPRARGADGVLLATSPPEATAVRNAAGTIVAVQCAPGTWQDPRGTTVAPQFSYSWRADGFPVGGATASTYPVEASDAGKSLTCVVDAVFVRGSQGVMTTYRGTAYSLPVVIRGAQCRTIPARPTTEGDPARVTLSAAQLLINQRIAQAAVRRVNAVQAWLDAGLTTDDLCGGAFAAQSFAPTVRVGATSTVVADASRPPSPRPVTSAKPRGSGDVGAVTVSARQLLIGQRISQAAVRRANGLTLRLDGGLTGGDLRSGVVTPAKLAVGLTVLSSRPGGDPPASTTVVAPPPARSDPADVTPSARQLLINQRIAQAAVRRSNALIDRLAAGFSSADFQPATITQRNLAAALLP